MWGYYFDQLVNSLPYFLKGLWMTVVVSGLSLVFGTVIGFLLGIIRAGRNKLLRLIIGFWVDVIRGTPFLVQIFIVFFILPELKIHLEAFPAAVLALSNLAACFICEIVLRRYPGGPGRSKRSGNFIRPFDISSTEICHLPSGHEGDFATSGGTVCAPD